MSGTKNGKKLRITVDHNLDETVIKKIAVDAEVAGKDAKGKIDFAGLRAGGFIKQRQKDKFTVRLNCPGGRMTIEKLKTVAKAAEKFGDKFVHFSVRQSLEIPTVDYHDFNELTDMLGSVEQKIASCGPRVRVPTACGGCEYNPNGIVDTQSMAQTITDMFFGRRTPHKFKISLSACPHDCIHSTGTDLGLQGAIFPKWDVEKCTGCTICSSACTEDAIESDKKTGQPIFDASQCIYCDDCVRACPTMAWEAEERGYMVRVGGHGGRHPAFGTAVANFLSDDETLKVIDGTITWYQQKGESHGRIRLGNLLLKEGMMASYMEMLKATIGDAKLEKNPALPRLIVTNPKGEKKNGK